MTSHTAQNDGVFIRALATQHTTTLMSGEGDYKQVVMDRAGGQVAFVSNRDDFKADKSRFALYYATVKVPQAVTIAAPGSVDLMSPADHGRLEFWRDGSAIIFGVAPLPVDTIPTDSLADKAVFDLWSWKDGRLQPQQKLEAARDRNRTWTTVHLIKAKRTVRLTNDTMPTAQVSDDGRTALIVTNVPYMIAQMWGDGGSDIFVEDVASGRLTPVARRQEFGAELSPSGKYVTWFERGKWNAFAVATGQTIDLTGAIKGVRFDDETWDSPATPAPYGLGGWTTDDHSVLIYDRFDVWEVDPQGSRPPRVVTDSVGVRNRYVLRLVDVDPDARFVDPSQLVLLRAFDDENKGSGFFRDRLDRVAPPERIVFGERNYGRPQRRARPIASCSPSRR